MHLFFDTVWKLHIGEIPEKPKPVNHAGFIEDWAYEELLKRYNEAIAAIKQNALTVGNAEILNFEHGEEYDTVIINGDEINKGEFYKWPGGYETKETYDKRIVTPGGVYKHNLRAVAILTLPEKKKNPMENIDEQIAKILRDNITFSGQVGDYVVHGAIDKIKELFTASGSVAAPKEERIFSGSAEEILDSLESTDDAYYHHSQIEPVIAFLRQQLKEREEALKEFAQILLDYKHSGVEVNIDYLLDKFPYENIEGKV